MLRAATLCALLAAAACPTALGAPCGDGEPCPPEYVCTPVGTDDGVVDLCASRFAGGAAADGDAGTIDDGGTIDDAGGADAGTNDDAGPVDAGPPDGGFVDAGLVDAGLVDAGLVDAGFGDAGFVDAGFADAGFGGCVATWAGPALPCHPVSVPFVVVGGGRALCVELDFLFPVDAGPTIDCVLAPPTTTQVTLYRKVGSPTQVVVQAAGSGPNEVTYHRAGVRLVDTGVRYLDVARVPLVVDAGSYWTGDAGTDAGGVAAFGVGANWFPRAPVAGDAVFVPWDARAMPLLADDVAVRAVYVETGAALHETGAPLLTVALDALGDIDADVVVDGRGDGTTANVGGALGSLELLSDGEVVGDVDSAGALVVGPTGELFVDQHAVSAFSVRVEAGGALDLAAPARARVVSRSGTSIVERDAVLAVAAGDEIVLAGGTLTIEPTEPLAVGSVVRVVGTSALRTSAALGDLVLERRGASPKVDLFPVLDGGTTIRADRVYVGASTRLVVQAPMILDVDELFVAGVLEMEDAGPLGQAGARTYAGSCTIVGAVVGDARLHCDAGAP